VSLTAFDYLHLRLLFAKWKITYLHDSSCDTNKWRINEWWWNKLSFVDSVSRIAWYFFSSKCNNKRLGAWALPGPTGGADSAPQIRSLDIGDEPLGTESRGGRVGRGGMGRVGAREGTGRMCSSKNYFKETWIKVVTAADLLTANFVYVLFTQFSKKWKIFIVRVLMLGLIFIAACEPRSRILTTLLVELDRTNFTAI